MGQLRYVLYRVSKLFPKKMRKPFILISSILGLIVFLNILTSWTNSVYLISVQSALRGVIAYMQTTSSLGWFIIFIIAIIGFCSYKAYSALQTAISMLYVVILILAVLPWIIG